MDGSQGTVSHQRHVHIIAPASLLSTQDDAIEMVQQQSFALSAHRRMTKIQWSALVVLFLSSAAFAGFAPGLALNWFFVTFTAFCLLATILRVLLVTAAIGHRAKSSTSLTSPISSFELRAERTAEAQGGDDPLITILLPLYREAHCLPALISAIEALDWPAERLDVKILLEEDDQETILAATSLKTLLPIEVLIVPEGGPKTKPKACNFGLLRARGTYTVIYDAEDRPEPDQLRKAVAGFRLGGPDLACLQARLNFYNRDASILTRLFTLEYTLLFDWLLPGFAQLNAPIPLGGTSNFFKTDILRKVGGWDPFNVTEDADLGLRLDAAGFKTDVLNSTTWEEAVPNMRPWVGQRSRWIKGYLQTWIVHARHRAPAFQRRRWQNAMTHHLFMGGVVLSAMGNPIFVILSLLAMFGGIIGPSPFLVALLSACSIIQIGLLVFAAQRRGWYGLIPAALLAPLYWMAQSIAGYKAVWEFFKKPFYWDKTEHRCGLEPETKNPQTERAPALLPNQMM